MGKENKVSVQQLAPKKMMSSVQNRAHQQAEDRFFLVQRAALVREKGQNCAKQEAPLCPLGYGKVPFHKMI